MTFQYQKVMSFQEDSQNFDGTGLAEWSAFSARLFLNAVLSVSKWFLCSKARNFSHTFDQSFWPLGNFCELENILVKCAVYTQGKKDFFYLPMTGKVLDLAKVGWAEPFSYVAGGDTQWFWYFAGGEEAGMPLCLQ